MFQRLTFPVFFLAVFFLFAPYLHAAERTLPVSPMTDSEKVDEILRSQQEIIQRLEEMKQELAIIKMRATR